MYAIIETGGRQYWVTQGEVLRVEKLKAEKGQDITFPALWAADAAAPGEVKKATVVAQVLDAKRAPKILVFKKRSKKAYKKMKGHRQNLTEILIKSISFN